MTNFARYAGLTLGLLVATSCGRGLELEENDIANAAGETMASLDEAAVGTANLQQNLEEKESSVPGIAEFSSTSCGFSGIDFTACSSGVRTRSWGGCTLIGATVEGTVTLTFSQSNCTMSSSGNSVTRTPNMTITGRRGRTLTITTATGGSFQGQRITRGASAGTFTVEVSKLRRVATDATSTTTLNIESNTGTAMTMTGAIRTGRKLDGGTLIITDALNSQTYTLTPEAVTWDGTCNCASSGQWTGTVATTGSSTTSTITIRITACGSADVTLNGVTTSVTLDRCVSLN
jgi:hypothetical protein